MSVAAIVVTARCARLRRACDRHGSASARMKNLRFAGRSANRRMKYPYHWVPNGTYTRTRLPAPASRDCSSARMPYRIWYSKSAAPLPYSLANADAASMTTGSCEATLRSQQLAP
jgi:hypothetical protein